MDIDLDLEQQKKKWMSRFAILNNRGLVFNALKGKSIDNLLEPYKKLFKLLPVFETENIEYYRARTVNFEKDVNTGKGIIEINGHLVGAFNEKESGKAPAASCKAGRLNDAGESVFYIAEDLKTVIAEMKPISGSYISVGKFSQKKEFKIFDFATWLRTNINDDFIIEQFQRYNEDEELDAEVLFRGVELYLTMPDYTEQDYKVSHVIAKALKELPIDGVKYMSYFTHKNNIAIWKCDDIDYEFEGSKLFYIDEQYNIVGNDDKITYEKLK